MDSKKYDAGFNCFTFDQASAVLESYGVSIKEYIKQNGENFSIIKILVFVGV